MNIIGKILEKVKEEALQEAMKPHTLGVYRASEIGGCDRALQYATLKYRGEIPSPELQLLFNDGHLHHHAVRDLLKGTGGTLSHVERTISKRYHHNGQRFTITGTVDGVFKGEVFDVKSISTFMFNKLDKDFPSNYPKYIAQITLYMDILEYESGFFVFKDKNSSSLKVIHVNFNPKVLTEILDRVAALHKGCKKKELLPQPYKASHFYCRTCPFRKPCWNLPMESKRWLGQTEWEATINALGSPNAPGRRVSLKRKLKASLRHLRKRSA